ncbi:hypothetical protein EWM64_g9321 [Hericium alpestre]|uniref:Uncharacterized protein n=1 Tax=Hericium alpestre TaxID=135208 RepID=A0A4Y9ZKH0_9AGAM|nr:hypothetical protein EWM64_g9321 [Hericium alpestre]
MTPASHQTEELYKRSVMIIIWYKAHTAPLRLLQPLPTFPFLQLSAYPTIVASLSLNENSFVDAYNAENGQWEQHTINTVRLAETEQRFLYRLRKSLLEGLSEDECPGIAEEIARQPHPGQMGSQRSLVAGGTLNGSLKRSAPDSDSPQAAKYYLADIYRGPSQAYPVPVAPPQSYPQNLSTPKEQTIQINTSPPSQHLQSPVANGHQHRSMNATKQQGPYLYQQGGLYAASSSVPSTPTQVGTHAASPPATSPVSVEALPAHLHTPPAPSPTTHTRR